MPHHWAPSRLGKWNWLGGVNPIREYGTHPDPGRSWTVGSLARSCNLSRSTFADRFATRVGTPPASYLAQVRLDAAATLLRDSSIPVGQIADKVGYTSEAAFSRAFGHQYGTPPAR